MPRAYIAVGANLGQREQNIERAIELLRQTPGVHVVKVSTLIETPAVGGPADSPPFLNGAIEIQSNLAPRELLDKLLRIEETLGRQRKEKWEPRIIDLDIVLFGDRVVDEPHLKIPHPLMHARRFVLEPLAQIAPELVHPVSKRTVSALLDDLRKTGE